MFVVNSRLGLSSAAGCRSPCGRVHRPRLSFSRSYGYILPSSLTRVFPRTSGFSPRPPVSVCGTGAWPLVRSFSRQCGPPGFASPEGSAPGRLSALCTGDLPPVRPAAFDALFQPRARTAPCVTPSSNGPMRYRNFRLLSFACACCLGLGPDLPRDDERCPGTLGLSVGRIPTALFATHTGILAAALSTCPHGHASPMAVRSPTHCHKTMPRLRFRA